MPASMRPSENAPIVSLVSPSLSPDLLNYIVKKGLTWALVGNCMLVVPVVATALVSCSTMRPTQKPLSSGSLEEGSNGVVEKYKLPCAGS
jgi:hypothetical protein